MSKEITKNDIIKSLKNHQKEVTNIIDGFKSLDEIDDARLNRVIAQGIVFTLFEFIDTLVNTEVDIHNFMKRRG